MRYVTIIRVFRGKDSEGVNKSLEELRKVSKKITGLVTYYNWADSPEEIDLAIENLDVNLPGQFMNFELVNKFEPGSKIVETKEEAKRIMKES